MVYVVDTVRCENPNTFMSNMMYALSIMYKAKLPIIVVFNKTDILSHEFCLRWMSDYEEFRDAVCQGDNYLNDLSRSMSLALDDFYNGLTRCGVSSVTGHGFD